MGADGLTIREQLARVTERTQDLVHRHASVFDKDVVPRLEEQGIRILRDPGWDFETGHLAACMHVTEVRAVAHAVAIGVAPHHLERRGPVPLLQEIV